MLFHSGQGFQLRDLEMFEQAEAEEFGCFVHEAVVPAPDTRNRGYQVSMK
jgi:hypothetical protein